VSTSPASPPVGTAPPAPTAHPAPTAPAPAGAEQRPGVVLLRWSGLLLVLAMVGFGSTQVVTSFFRQSERSTTPLTGSVRQVVLGTNVGDVHVRAARPGEDSRLIRHDDWTFERAVVTSSIASGVLTVDTPCPDWGPVMQFCAVDFDLVVPAAASVVIRTDTGDLSVRGMAGTVQASTSTGDISMVDLLAADVRATSSTGDVSVALARPPTSVQARTSTGDVRVVVPDDGSTYRLLSSSSSVGTRTVRVPTDPESTRMIDVSTSVGDISVTAR
jgi:hypothetical protein